MFVCFVLFVLFLARVVSSRSQLRCTPAAGTSLFFLVFVSSLRQYWPSAIIAMALVLHVLVTAGPFYLFIFHLPVMVFLCSLLIFLLIPLAFGAHTAAPPPQCIYEALCPTLLGRHVSHCWFSPHIVVMPFVCNPNTDLSSKKKDGISRGVGSQPQVAQQQNGALPT